MSPSRAEGPGPGALALRHLLRSSHTAATDDLPALVTEAAAGLGAVAARVYVVDYDQTSLVPLVAPGGAGLEPLAVEGTKAGRAFTDISPLLPQDEPYISWLPLLDGADRVGVLEVAAKSRLDVDELLDLADVVGQLVVARSAVGDLVERARRRVPMALAAEMQWNLLPPLTFSSGTVDLSGSLIPAHEVAGDCFDYALNGSVAHFALFDAMGHGLRASLVASVALGAYRNGRRSGLDLSDTVRSIDKFVEAMFGDAFVTGVVAELDVASGSLHWVSCGHHPALLVRDGHVVKELDGSENLPLGMQGEAPTVAHERLEPDDRVLVYSDGVIEARDTDGEWFGTERLVDFVARASSAGLPPAETMRRLVRAILTHQAGDLQDDATTVIVEWRGPEG